MTKPLDDFMRDVSDSGLLSDADLRAWIDTLPADSRPQEGEQLARELVKHKKLTKFQAEQLYAGKGKSLTLGNYVILDKLGQGGMGVVLKAEHKRLKRLVALKVMSPAAVKSAEALKRFHREVEAAAKLRHPNVVATDDADEAKGTHFLVMEYVEGSDLSVLVKNHGPLPPEQAVRCIIQAARGLEFAHEQGVIHRDIKPANLLIDAKGTVKILDMGLARIDGAVGGSSEGAGLTSTGTIMGTVDYMSPEQAMDTKHADARSDIYSLGCSLYYLLTGKVVYDGDTMMKKLMAHQHGAIPELGDALRSRNRQISDVRGETAQHDEHGSLTTSATNSLDAVFRRMVAKKPEDRPQSMTEVIAELERCLSGGSPTVVYERSGSSATNITVSGASGSGNELQDFLRHISGGEPATATSGKPSGTVVSPSSAEAETMISSADGAGTDPRTEQTLTLERSGKPKSRLKWLVGSIAAAVVVLLAVVFAMRGNSGTLVLEINDGEIEVTLGDTGRTVKGKSKHTLQVPIGELVLHVQREELAFDTDPFDVPKGEPVTIKVERVGRAVRAMMGETLLGFKEEPSIGAPPTTTDFALEFDGVDDYVDLPSLSCDTGKPITLEGWVTPFSADGHSHILVLHGETTVSIQQSEGSWHGLRLHGGTLQMLGEPMMTPPSGRPTHLALVWDGSRQSLFVDGKRSSLESTGSANQCGVSGALLGCVRLTDSDPSLKYFFRGKIDELRVSKVARYQKEFTPKNRFESDGDTLALYHFDEGSGSELKDSSGNNHHGQIVGANWVRADGRAIPQPTPDDYALDLSDGARVVAPATVDTARPFTVELFALPRGLPPADRGNCGLVYSNGLDFHFKQHGGNAWVFGLDPTDHELFLVRATDASVVGRKTHLAAVVAEEEMRLFVDGKLAKKTAIPRTRGSKAGQLGIGLALGDAPNWSPFQGLVDEVRISQVARYEKDFSPRPRLESDKDTLALYHFDEGQGDVLKDSSSNNHHGKIIGAKWVRVDGVTDNLKSEISNLKSQISDTQSPPPAKAPFDAKQARTHQEEWARYLGVPVEYSNPIGMKFVLIPPGEFTMGSSDEEVAAVLKDTVDPPDWLQKHLETEVPARSVTLTKPFFCGVHEVTIDQFRKFVETGYQPESIRDGMGGNVLGGQPLGTKDQTWERPHHWEVNGEFPVTQVTWNDARAFAEWLSRSQPQLAAYDLPTEAQWEFACRAGTKTRHSTGDTLPPKQLAQGIPVAVGRGIVNPFGLYDMHGNVAEWCLDTEIPNAYRKLPSVDPVGMSATGSNRMVRGGGNSSPAPMKRSSHRVTNKVSDRLAETGFRLTVSVDFVRRETGEQANAPSPTKSPFDAKQARAHQEAWAKHLGTTVETINSVGAKMILIPPGEFLMGSTDEQVAAALKVADEIKAGQEAKDLIQNAERPQHKVAITKPFLVGKTEVTNGQFQLFVDASQYVTEAEQYGFSNSDGKVMDDKVADAQKKLNWRNPGFVVNENSPVTQITWNDAMAYCLWLSTQEKATYRLPTEAEWEYACRAGMTTQYSFGDDHQVLEQFDWYIKNANAKTHQVGTKLPNAFGLFDMHGNLEEWCGDFFDEKWYETSPLNDPRGPPTVGSSRVLRGGNWRSNAAYSRSASRYRYRPSFRNSDNGFRVVRELGNPAVAPDKTR